MTRRARRLAVFAFGVVFAVTIAVVSGRGEPAVQPGDVMGSPDLAAECRRLHGGDAIASLRDQNADSWVCGHIANGVFVFDDIDPTAACHAQFGNETSATKVDESPFGWRCLRAAE